LGAGRGILPNQKERQMPKYICPHCKQPIDDDEALLCLYCGESLNRAVGFMGKLRYPRPKTIIIIIVLLLIGSFMLLMLI
jgi:predicted amidophosphoribosyltransferase